jgi:hypothetical protein
LRGGEKRMVEFTQDEKDFLAELMAEADESEEDDE